MIPAAFCCLPLPRGRVTLVGHSSGAFSVQPLGPSEFIVAKICCFFTLSFSPLLPFCSKGELQDPPRPSDLVVRWRNDKEDRCDENFGQFLPLKSEVQ